MLVLLQATTPTDFSLQDAGWIVGGVVAFTLFMLFKDQIIAFFRRATVKNYAPPARPVMSPSTGSAHTGLSAEPVRADLVLPDTHQAEPGNIPEENDAPILPISHNMDDETLTLLLAAQKTLDGKPRWSANEIVKMIGGTRQEVLDTIAIVRPREKPVEEAPARPTPAAVKPITGRPYDPKQFHSDNPELQYQEP